MYKTRNVYHPKAKHTDNQTKYSVTITQWFSDITQVIEYNSSLERSCSKGLKTGFICTVGPVLKILGHFH